MKKQPGCLEHVKEMAKDGYLKNRPAEPMRLIRKRRNALRKRYIRLWLACIMIKEDEYFLKGKVLIGIGNEYGLLIKTAHIVEE